MPPAVLPPTPASSTDIQGQDGSKQLAALQTSFELPPPALAASAGDHTSASPTSPETSAANGAARRSADASKLSPQMAPERGPTSSSKMAYPMQAAEAVKSRRRSSAAAAAAAAKDAFALPPPPTRARKIIQVKPRAHAASAGAGPGASGAAADQPVELRPAQGRSAAGSTAGNKGSNAATGTTTPAATAAATATAATATATAAGGKRKSASSTSAAGRKIARKTAHSLIERRRRSKMNEEFAVLKNMIPACTGEMHKLAILQASIEYVRYLEECVASLKARHETEKQQQQEHHQHVVFPPAFSQRQHQGQYDPAHPYLAVFPTACNDGSASPDIEMDDAVDQNDNDGDGGDDDSDDADDVDENLPSPTWNSAHPRSAASSSRSTPHQPSVSPALLAQDVSRRRQQSQDSQSSTASTSAAEAAAAAAAAAAAIEHHRHYSYSTSTQASPAFDPQPSYLFAAAASSVAGLTLTSPALPPQRDLDQEATAALLMLNSDRRGSLNGSGTDSRNSVSNRGMSVRDLLST